MSTVLAPVPAGSAAKRRSALLGISLGYFMVLLDTTVLSVAEPDLARSLGASVAGLQWAVTGYTVVLGALLLSAGAVADRHGAHRVFRASIAVFGAGSLLCAAAPDLWTLVALRAVLGVAAAGCVPASMALIARLYPVPAERARAVAAWAATSGAALAAGPIAGGALVGLAGWRAIFLVNVPLAAAVLALVAGRAVACPRGSRAIDRPAQLLACAAAGLLTDALIALGAGAGVHAACSAAGAVAAGAAFAARERGSAAPVLVPAVLRAPGMPFALAAGAAVNFVMTGVLFVLPLVFQQTLGLTPLRTGLAFLPMTLPFAFNPLLTGRIVARTGPRLPVLAGLALLTAAGVLFGAVLAGGATYPALVAGLLCTGFGVSFALPALATLAVTAAPEGTAGAAGGLLNAVRQLGAALGVAVMGSFAAERPGTALLIAAAVCAAVLPAGLRGVRPPAGRRPS
ncbi:MFS transporter, DHA2 family, methylenomycin A resistance protein [Actinomadura meyerae]|jgi:DHA2 family methylenomycin A resistance protein-like MFS transporter|uniref:MFS transporter, DHA2 family, methylenomycin A resistance protein n=1 Tax=Actinomadura meyerae TaxID=240840 RepID=A0A239MXR2_9ACTN|nr:MFS transporter [Actinomadura meyerae]SNT47587.1 MFS transporter, DHA2 family, methylenomycin A resistance protein [Actinomadura meyerae]